ncbi:ral guanine nucleotide dissociation stimulator-like [Choloepus didactylus]|uniref:ral guanine nucleotide dissociation stimulator-like n=1 Tax=Choloepus didactylus TaxID=27675 RepID=UPI00189E6B76|nr:ral guanine nucleotide dissociation stimulator-like [Choloepus didactylus]
MPLGARHQHIEKRVPQERDYLCCIDVDLEFWNPMELQTLGTQRANTPAQRRVQDSRERTHKERALVKLLELLVPAVQEGDRVYVTNLLINYRGFLSIEEVLDQVSKRYADNCSFGDGDGGGQEGFKNSISCLLLTWLEELPSDFCQHPGVPCLKQLVAFAQVALPGSALERRAQDLLSQLEPAEPSETETEAPVSDPEVKTSAVPPPEPVPSMAPDIIPAPEAEAPVALPPVLHAVAEPLQVRELQPPTPAMFIPPLELEATLKPPAVPSPEVATSPAAASLTELPVALRPPLLTEVEAFMASDVEPSSSPADSPSPELEAAPLPPPEVMPFPTEELEPVNSIPAASAPQQEVAPVSPILPLSDPAPVPPLDIAPVNSPTVVTAAEQEEILMSPATPLAELNSPPALAAPPEPSCCSPASLEHGLKEVKSPLSEDPPRLVAKQKTLMQVGDQVMPRIQHLQAGSSKTHFRPVEQLGVCSGDMEQLSEAECPVKTPFLSALRNPVPSPALAATQSRVPSSRVALTAAVGMQLPHSLDTWLTPRSQISR